MVGKSGPDDLLELGSAGSQQPVGMIIPDKNAQDEGIEVFRNPTLSGFLIYDPQSKQLLKSTKPVELVEKGSSGSLNIVRMSHADQRAIMAEFAKNYSAREDTRGLERVLEGMTRFIGRNSTWSSRMQNSFRIGYISDERKWLNFCNKGSRTLVSRKGIFPV